MANAKRDGNRVPSVIGVAHDDGITPVTVYVDKTTHRLYVDASITTGLSAQTGVVDGEAVDVADLGVLILGTDGSNYQVLATDASGNLQVDIVSGAVTNAGIFAVQPGAAVTGPGNPTIDSYAHIAINLDAGANQVLVASAANKQIWVYAVNYTCSVAGTVSFQDEDDTAVTGIMDHAANSGMGGPPSGNFAMPIWKLATNKDLEVDIVTASVDGWLDYSLVSV